MTNSNNAEYANIVNLFTYTSVPMKVASSKNEQQCNKHISFVIASSIRSPYGKVLGFWSK